MRFSHLFRMSLTVLLAVTVCLASVARKPTNGNGFDLASLDTTCKPCDDFYQYANGGWLKSNPVPAAYPSWGRFDELNQTNEGHLRSLLEEAARNRNAPKGTAEQKIGDFYASAMDEAGINAQGIKPLASELERIAKVKDQSSLQDEIAHLNMLGVNAPFSFSSTQDFKDSTQVIGVVSPGGLGLPDRDYYLKDDDDSKRIRGEYVRHLVKMFVLLGESEGRAAAAAKTVVDVETALAKASLTRVERRDPNKTYHRMTVAQLQQLAPNLNWSAYYRNIGLTKELDANVRQPEFMKEVNNQLKALPLDGWKTYLRWHLINLAAPSLSKPFVDQDFEFYGRVINGTKEILPRWKRSVQATDGALGEALGQVYVKKYFPPEARDRMREMIRNMKDALREDITTLEWMGDATRKQAIAKLEAFVDKIGYPDVWRDYSTLSVDRSSFIQNVLRANTFEVKRNLAQIGKPLDRTEWGITPPTVNAYYSSSLNEIVFPAGILQPPFFDPNADDAINYGGIAAVIGHEMTHGFDDQGAKFDAKGNLENWWSADDLTRFKERSECVVKQFDSFVVDGDLHHDGKLVVGESVADLGGLAIAYKAFWKSMEGKARPEAIDGFTPEQRFFLGWAQVWSENNRPEFARLLAKTNPHPLGKFRVNGPLTNMPAFAEAFGCKMGERMVRADKERCQIW
jgi:putative endopeptidase